MSTARRVSLSALPIAVLGTTALPAAAARAAPPAPKVERVSVAPDGTEADGASDGATLSGDGRHVAFRSDAENLTEGHQGPYDYGFVRDLRTGRTRHVADTPATSASRDGRYAVLTAAEGDTLTLLDLRTGRRTPVGPGEAVPGAVTAKGREVAFTSGAADLVPGDTKGWTGVFVRHH